MGKMKITYFGVRARVEIARLVLAAAKKDYDYVEVEFKDWPTVKPKMDFGVLPVLEIDGQQFSQGIAIQTYLAKTNGLYGDNPLDQLKIDEISLMREDMLIPETKEFLESDEAKKAEIAKSNQETHYPKFLQFFVDILKKSKTDWAVGKKMTLADIVIFEGTTTVSQLYPDIFKKYPDLVKLREKVSKAPGIKEYLAKNGERRM